MFFLESEHLGMGGMPPHPPTPTRKKKVSIEWEKKAQMRGGFPHNFPPRNILEMAKLDERIK